MASERRSLVYHCLIRLAARRLATKVSQSRLGPAPSTLDVKISTESPEPRRVSRGINRPLIFEPTQLWPTSVWIA